MSENRFISLYGQFFPIQCSSCTHQLQAECASVGRGIVHSTITLFVSHTWICVIPQKVFHTSGKDNRQGKFKVFLLSLLKKHFKLGIRDSLKHNIYTLNTEQNLLPINISSSSVVQGATASLVQLIDACPRAHQGKHTLVVTVG